MDIGSVLPHRGHMAEAFGRYSCFSGSSAWTFLA